MNIKVEKDKGRIVATIMDVNGTLRDIPVGGSTHSNILTLYTENLMRSELTDKEIQQVREYVGTRWDIEID